MQVSDICNKIKIISTEKRVWEISIWKQKQAEIKKLKLWKVIKDMWIYKIWLL